MNILPTPQRQPARRSERHPEQQRAAAMTLLALETMPCGCVAAVYQARPTIVEVEFVEAKGPHCVFSVHRAGHVTRLGVPESMVADTGEPLV
jgi:hypothetical protein